MGDKVTSINIAPTWGEMGNIFMRLALSGETEVLANMKREFARAMSAAEVLKVLLPTLTEEQKHIVTETYADEMMKQGF